MSRIGKLPISIPDEVSVDVEENLVKVTGPKGTIKRTFPEEISFDIKDKKVFVTAERKDKRTKAMHGTTRAILANMIQGVSAGWSKTLELVGAGYKAEVSGNTLTLLLGYSHPVKIHSPEGISFKVEKSEITVEGVDKELVGQIAAKIRKARQVEPYKGKGIRYTDEVVRRKPGKAAKTQGAAA